jgi:hypothetical protein
MRCWRRPKTDPLGGLSWPRLNLHQIRSMRLRRRYHPALNARRERQHCQHRVDPGSACLRRRCTLRDLESRCCANDQGASVGMGAPRYGGGGRRCVYGALGNQNQKGMSLLPSPDRPSAPTPRWCRRRNAKDQARGRDDSIICAQHRRPQPPDAFDQMSLFVNCSHA